MRLLSSFYQRILPTSKLYDQDTFYPRFHKDLLQCQHELIIESPFITTNRVDSLLPIFKKIRSRSIRIVINTRHPHQHNTPYNTQAWQTIQLLQSMGIEILFTGGHHRKLAIVDRTTLWEGSLNILSQNDSCEIMRRIKSPQMAIQTINFIKLSSYLR